MTRSRRVSWKSAPSAPTYVRSTHAVSAPAAAPIASHGTSGPRSSRQRRRPRFHQSTTSRAAGNVAVTVLLKSATRVELQVEECRTEAEAPRQGVLEFGHPGDRLDLDRMQREQHGGQDGAGHADPPQQHRDHRCGRRVQEDVQDVIAERVVTPGRLHQPERRVHDGVVLLRCAEMKPDTVEPRPRFERGVREMRAVVPEASAVPRGLIGDEGRKRQSGEQLPHRRARVIARSRGGSPCNRCRRARATTRGSSHQEALCSKTRPAATARASRAVRTSRRDGTASEAGLSRRA